MKVWIYNHQGIRFRLSPTPITDRDIPSLVLENKEQSPWLIFHRLIDECQWICKQIPDGKIGELEL